MESERKTKFEKKNKPGKFIAFYTIQLVLVVYYAKFEASVLCSSCEIFDERIEWMKKKKKKKKKKKQRRKKLNGLFWSDTIHLVTVYL